MNLALDDVSRARRTLSGWVRFTTRFLWRLEGHLRYLERKLMDVAAGRCKRLMVFMPPRHGKSETVSRYFASWFLGAFPDKRVILCSYEADFAASWGRKARDLLAEYGREVFGVSVRADTSAANRWEIAGHRGGMQTAGVGGAVTGKGCDVLIVDDPVKNAEEAASKTYRERAWDWWRSTAYTRLEPDGAAIVIQTRWHEDDLSGRLLREMKAGGEQWDVVYLPALAGAGDVLGRELGAALWPARFPRARLLEIKTTVGSYYFSALYQQRPSPEEGGDIKRKWFRYYTEPQPELFLLGTDPIALSSLFRFTTTDLATSLRETADYTVASTWGLHPDGLRLLLLNVVRDRVEGPDIIPLIQREVQRWESQLVWIERDGFQLSVVQRAVREGLPAREWDPRPYGDKRARVLSVTPMFEQGHVWFPRSAGWLGDFEEELVVFPKGDHDDQVDTVSCAGLVSRGPTDPSDPPGFAAQDWGHPFMS